jgi:hypothetical protein
MNYKVKIKYVLYIYFDVKDKYKDKVYLSIL